MADKATAMRFLANLTTEEIISILPQDVLDEISTRSRQGSIPNAIEINGTGESNTNCAIDSSTSKDIAASIPRNRKPLNAFMAFRAFYSTIFPETQQKLRSGYLTTLWRADQSKDKWALIARVYSLIRDEVGKSNAPLAPFLAVACPAMNIIPAETYLDTLGWSLVGDKNSELKLLRSPSSTAPRDEQPCVTASKLLSTCITRGYAVKNSQALLDKMALNANSAMTSAKPSVPENSRDKKADFLDIIKRDPFIAAAKLLNIPTNDSTLQLGVNVVMVDDGVEMDIFDAEIFGSKPNYGQTATPPASKHQDLRDAAQFHRSMLVRPQTRISCDQAQEHQLASSATGLIQTNGPVLDLNAVSEFAGIDIRNPFDVGGVLGYYSMEGKRTDGQEPDLGYDPKAVFFPFF